MVGLQTTSYLDKFLLAQGNSLGWRVRLMQGNKREYRGIWGLRMWLKLVECLTSVQKA